MKTNWEGLSPEAKQRFKEFAQNMREENRTVCDSWAYHRQAETALGCPMYYEDSWGLLPYVRTPHSEHSDLGCKGLCCTLFPELDRIPTDDLTEPISSHCPCSQYGYEAFETLCNLVDRHAND